MFLRAVWCNSQSFFYFILFSNKLYEAGAINFSMLQMEKL